MTETMRRVLAFLLLTVLAAAEPLAAGVGYGYKRSEDPLVLGIKRIILHARKRNWKSARAEFRLLDWQFREFRKDLRIDIAAKFEAALTAESIAHLSREISRVMYFALVQKFHWNRVERCGKYVPAKSRVDAAKFYYEEILSIGVRDFDGKNEKEVHRRILEDFKSLRDSIGTAGLFGLGARPPDLTVFEQRSESILRSLRTVYRHLTEGATRLDGSAEHPREPDTGVGPKEP